MGRTRDLIIDLHNASGGGEGLAGIGMTAGAGRVLARPAALTALLRDIALLILDVGRFRVACHDPVGQVAVGRFDVLAHVPVIARAHADRRGR